MKKQKIIFLDRDGTLCDDKGAFHKKIMNYEELINNINLIEGTKESLKKLKDRGYLLILISNQAGVAKGKFKERDVHRFNKNLNNLLDNMIDGIYYCIHHDCGLEKDHSVYNENKIIKELIFDCDCRKPHIGLFLQAQRDLKNGKLQYLDENVIKSNESYIKDRDSIFKKDIEPCIVDKEKSFMIGDKPDDTLAGKRYGVRSFAVLTGEGEEDFKAGKYKLGENVDYIVKDINEAINKILEMEA